MKELKEPEIKLFGRKILLPDNGGVVAAGEISGGDCDRCMEEEKDDDEKELIDEEEQVSETKMPENDQNTEESHNQESSDENPKTPPIDESVDSETDLKCETNGLGPQKALKKPDKILPCPRCNSMDTKFCYYNNYNVNQPRHFCKSCQRYWTAGGTMRNVPVGAGRRKNKNSGPQCHHITITEALQAAANRPHHPSFKPNGTVLSFGPDSPLCESMASAMNLAEGRAIRNGYHKNVENINENRPDVGGQNGPKQPVINNLNGFPFPVPCIPGVPWNYPWSSAVPIPAICPVPFYPSPYWNYNGPNIWNFPWVPAHQKTTTSPGPTSPLGKHSRNGELLRLNGSENKEHSEAKSISESSIVVPKTLRIDDPEEAAKSSIWETLGIKYDSVSRDGLFKALQPKKSGDEKLNISPSSVLQANPAALSRSISFREGV